MAIIFSFAYISKLTYPNTFATVNYRPKTREENEKMEEKNGRRLSMRFGIEPWMWCSSAPPPRVHTLPKAFLTPTLLLTMWVGQAKIHF